MSSRNFAGKVAEANPSNASLSSSLCSGGENPTIKSLSALLSYSRWTLRTRTVHSTSLPWCLRRNSSFCNCVRLLSFETRTISAKLTGDDASCKGEGAEEVFEEASGE